MIKAAVLGLDGQPVEAEEDWERSRLKSVACYGGACPPDDQRAILGSNMRQCCRYIAGGFWPPLGGDRIAEALVERRMDLYREWPVALPSALDVVRSLADAYPLAIASSSPPQALRFVVDAMGGDGCVRAASDDVERRKLAPDVYLRSFEGITVGGEE